MFQSEHFSKQNKIRHGFLQPAETPPPGFLNVHQVHGKDVLFISELTKFSKETKADGLLTHQKLPVAIQTADCMPVLFFAESSSQKYVAAIHAGWRGLYEGILIHTVGLFLKQGFKKEEINIAIGPHIKACCFEVDSAVLEKFESRYKKTLDLYPEPYAFRTQPVSESPEHQAKATNNQIWIDLFAIAHAQLRQLGISSTQINHSALCTYCSFQDGKHLFESYRRFTHENKNPTQKSGRQWSYIELY